MFTRRIALLTCVVSLSLASGIIWAADELKPPTDVQPAIAPTPAASAPAAVTPQQLDAIDARLKKLDDVLQQLQSLRQVELPKLQRDAQGGAETSVLRKEPTEKPADGMSVLTEKTPPFPAGAAPAAGAVPAAPEGRLAEIDAKLRKIDEISQQLLAVRNEDLPKLQKSIRGARETSARVNNPATGPAVSGDAGRLIIENVSPFGRDVVVNGTTYRIMPGSWSVDVPLGPVTTQLGGTEVSQEWSNDFWKRTDSGPEMRLKLR